MNIASTVWSQFLSQAGHAEGEFEAVVQIEPDMPDDKIQSMILKLEQLDMNWTASIDPPDGMTPEENAFYKEQGF